MEGRGVSRSRTEEDKVPSLPDLGIGGAMRFYDAMGEIEPQQTWLARKCDAQKTQIRLLLAVVAASKQGDLATRYVRDKAYLARMQSMWAKRESAYVKGYEKGYMDAMKRHGIDQP